MFISSSLKWAPFLLPCAMASVIIIPQEVKPIRRADTETDSSNIPTTSTQSIGVDMSSTTPSATTATGDSFSDPSATVPGTITSFPTFSTSFCSQPTTIAAAYCSVTVGTVKLHFWPTSDPSLIYPSTVVLPQYDYTMYSPSVYYEVNTMEARNYCGQLIGPVVTDFITGYNLDKVSTLQPYADTTVTTRMGSPQQLKLNDLRPDCPVVEAADVPVNNHNIYNETNVGCNPVLEYRIDLKDAVADGAWALCDRASGGNFGIFDPPVPVTTCTDADCGDDGASAKTTSKNTKASTSPTTVPDKGGKTSSTHTAAPGSTSPSPAKPTSTDPPAATSTAVTPDPPKSTAVIPASTAVHVVSTPDPVTSEKATSVVVTPPKTSTKDPAPTTSAAIKPVASTPVVSAASQTPSAVIQPVRPVSTPVATLPNSAVVSVVAGGSSIVVGTTTLGQGQAITTGVAVVSLGSSGVVISNTANGQVTTSAIAAAASIVSNQLPSVGVVFGVTISAQLVQSSVAVIGGAFTTQSVSIGGPQVTISDNQVATLASSGLVIAAPNGVVSTFVLSSATPTAVTPGGISISLDTTSSARKSAGFGAWSVFALAVALVLGFQ